MLSPDAARLLLAERGVRGVDDPTEAGLAYRWWLDADHNLKGAWWRGAVTNYGRTSSAQFAEARNPEDAPLRDKETT